MNTPVMAPDEPTAWELQRSYTALRQDMQRGFEGVNTRLDRIPTEATITALMAAVDRRQHDTEQDVADLKNDLKAERLARAADRRLVVGAILTAVGSLAVMIVSSLIGMPT